MSFKEVSFNEVDVVTCVLKKRREGKAIPTSAHIADKHEEHLTRMNNLNQLVLPGEPAKFWIERNKGVSTL